jgi:Protein of unknown function (DUF2442)
MNTLANKPVADAVDVACTDDELIYTLVDGRRVSAPLAWFPRLLRATPKQRANWRLIGRGVGIHWNDLEEIFLFGLFSLRRMRFDPSTINFQSAIACPTSSFLILTVS